MSKAHPDDGNDHFKLVDLQWVKAFTLPIIFVFGGPGAGKASMCFKFRIRFGVSYFSMGQLLREEAREPTKRGREIAKYVHNQPSQKVPVELVMDVLRDMLIKLVAAQKPIFIQGFPRDFAQAVHYEKEIAPIKHAIFLNASEKTAVQRLVNRNKLAGRFEDEVNILRMRREAFCRDVLPIVENLLNEGRVYEVDGNGTMHRTFADALEIYTKWIRHHRKNVTRSQYRDEGSSNYCREIITREQNIQENATEKSFPTARFIGPFR